MTSEGEIVTAQLNLNLTHLEFFWPHYFSLGGVGALQRTENKAISVQLELDWDSSLEIKATLKM